jgi:hypothetical protein
MVDKRQENRPSDLTLYSVVKEMAKPRLVASVRDRVVKFKLSELLHNCDTQEDGRVSRINANKGVNTYEVWIPKDGNSWKGGYFISHWRENVLQLSRNARLKESTKKLRGLLNFMLLHFNVGERRFPEV